MLASGSKGNSVFVFDKGIGILIDCGISRKQLLFKLNNLGYEEADINYVLLTHDHYDHNKNITIFDINKVYCGENCIKGIDEKNQLIPYQDVNFNHLVITPLSISHDANSPLAFVIKGEVETLLYMTDTGYISQKNISYMENLDYYIIESNHDIEMLMATKRPTFLKKRILSDVGHLDNHYSAKTISKVIGDKTKEIVLAHLSEEANSESMALKTYYQIFNENQIQFDNIKVASQVDVVSGGGISEDKDSNSREIKGKVFN